MAQKHVINVDLADVWAGKDRKKLLRTLAWGDEVGVISQTSSHVEVSLATFHEDADGSVLPDAATGFIAPTKSSGIKAADVVLPRNENKVLKVNFVDVQQGDGAVIETPDGKVILVDGGDNQLFARYLAARFRGTSAAKPEGDRLHSGDARRRGPLRGPGRDPRVRDEPEPRKRLFIAPKRVYHNGLVKRPSTRAGRRCPRRSCSGRRRSANGRRSSPASWTDLLTVPDDEMNEPFKAWKKALASVQRAQPRSSSGGSRSATTTPSTSSTGDDLRDRGPRPVPDGGAGTPGAEVPRQSARRARASATSRSSSSDGGFKGLSASHTINGHSIVFRLTLRRLQLPVLAAT